MQQIFKLCKYYFKRLLKRWYFWFFLTAMLLFVFAWPYIVYTKFGQVNWETGKFVKNNELYPQYKNFLREFFGIVGDDKIRKGNSPLSQVGKFLALSAKSNSKDILVNIWQFFSWLTSGILASGFFMAPAIATSISTPCKDGEDKTVLNVASPIKRDDLVISKTLAIFLFLLLGYFLTFTLPFFLYYCFLMEFSFKVGLTFLLAAGLFFPLLHFLFFAAPLILLDFVSPVLRWIFTLILSFGLPLWNGIEAIFNQNRSKLIVEKTAKAFNSNFLVIIPCAILIGSLSLLSYRRLFHKKDFN